ncbi:hypothetical protein CEK26_001203 [Fusarium fujikuroi]|nr:hypothetical protein CEK27_001203 [Fusarium fujikuroi]QGI76292.1 hypothetical protein CEK25_001198 [Fusarium fujikuroi]QGI89988.1 hypothetical protein CEK26_001203 [Fusarium fujikuroi]
MASHSRSASAMGGQEKTYFEQQREALIGEIAMAQTGAQVGNEFSSVEALWSQFENVMDKDGKAEGETDQADQTEHHEEEGDTTVKHEGA